MLTITLMSLVMIPIFVHLTARGLHSTAELSKQRNH